MTYNEVMERSDGYMIDFLDSYIETALWSSYDNANDQGGEPLDKNYSAKDLAPMALAKMSADCVAFVGQAGDLLDEFGRGGVTRAGHDFWLTRNGHGAGFWDGDWPDGGDKLTELSKQFGEVDLYVGDDGRLYV